MIIDKKDKSINAHNIVTNSYSCGIGEQNQNALMMGNGNQAKCSRIFLLYNFKCLSCKLLPLCWGPCAQKQLEYPGNIKRFCQLELMEISLEDYVFFTYNNQILRNKIYANE